MREKKAQKERFPRVMFAAPASGSGKTLISCALMRLLQKRGLTVQAFKCGPDYIDPLLHRALLDRPSYNLDTWFTAPGLTRSLFASHAVCAADDGADSGAREINLIEGVMGYFDGIAGTTTGASSAELAQVLALPVILIVDARGMSRSVLALLRGFLEEEARMRAGGELPGEKKTAAGGIRGVFFNRTSAGIYERLKPLVERELGLAAVGYLPEDAALSLESRHLGLRLPEIFAAGEKAPGRDPFFSAVDRAAQLLEETADVADILRIASEAPPLAVHSPAGFLRGMRAEGMSVQPEEKGESRPVRIAVARDEAFCFLYEDNLELLRMLGAELLFFSPLRDAHLPGGRRKQAAGNARDGASGRGEQDPPDGLYLPGGYPELYAKPLAENLSMKESIRRFALAAKRPVFAECGGFLYLQRTLRDAAGKVWPMAGVLDGQAFWTGRSARFGYAQFAAEGSAVCADICAAAGGAGFSGTAPAIRGHEFHYCDCTENGNFFSAEKPVTGRTWECVVRKGHVFGGFPHFYFWSAPVFAERFLALCRADGRAAGGEGS